MEKSFTVEVKKNKDTEEGHISYLVTVLSLGKVTTKCVTNKVKGYEGKAGNLNHTIKFAILELVDGTVEEFLEEI